MVSVWGYGLDVYDGGAVLLTGEQAGEEPVVTTAQDLRFITRYQLAGLDALKTIAETFYYEGLLFILALVVLPLPGCLLLLLFQFRWVASITETTEERRRRLALGPCRLVGGSLCPRRCCLVCSLAVADVDWRPLDAMAFVAGGCCRLAFRQLLMVAG